MESGDHESALLKLAETVSDGVPVDWSSGAGLREASGSDLAPLQLLEKVADAYRSTARPPRPGSLPPGAEAGLLHGARDRQCDTPAAQDTVPSRRSRRVILIGVLAGVAVLALFVLLFLGSR
jgi:hypothetical protein